MSKNSISPAAIKIHEYQQPFSKFIDDGFHGAFFPEPSSLMIPFVLQEVNLCLCVFNFSLPPSKFDVIRLLNKYLDWSISFL
jgi:hypothetical protein